MQLRSKPWLMACLVPAAVGAAACELKSWDALSDRSLSPLATTLLGDAPGAWIHAEGGHFIVHGQSQADVMLACREAEFAYLESAVYVGDDNGTGKCHLFVVDKEATWTRLLEAGSLRTDGLALYLDDTVYIFRGEEDAFGPLKIPAEVMHMRFQRNLGGDCPLWLEEGLSDFAGWRIACTWYRKRYRRVLQRTRDALPADALMSWEEVAAVTELPAGIDEARAFSRQANRMFRTIAERLGEDQLPAFIRAVCMDGNQWRSVLAGRFHLTPQDLAALEQTARQAVTQEETE